MTLKSYSNDSLLDYVNGITIENRHFLNNPPDDKPVEPSEKHVQIESNNRVDVPINNKVDDLVENDNKILLTATSSPKNDVSSTKAALVPNLTEKFCRFKDKPKESTSWLRRITEKPSEKSKKVSFLSEAKLGFCRELPFEYYHPSSCNNPDCDGNKKDVTLENPIGIMDKSVDSIGSCSLDVDASSTDFSGSYLVTIL